MEGVAKNFEKDLRNVGEEKDENESKEDENVEKSKEDENVEKEEKNAGEESEDWIAGYCKWFNFNKGWGFLNISGQFILEYSFIKSFTTSFVKEKLRFFVFRFF